MKTILYATDYSQNSVAALRLGHIMSKKFNVKLIVMHVYDVPLSLSTISVSHMNKEKRLLSKNYSKLKEFCTLHLGDSWKSCDIHFVVKENVSVVDGILEQALKYEVDIIIMGSKGASAFKDFLLGNATMGLIKKAPCAVLAVPAISKPETFKTMVYATDFQQADILAINKLVEIANKFNALIKIVHISRKKEYAGNQQMEWFKEMLKQKVKYEKIEFDLIFSDHIFEELNTYLNKSEINLFAILERKDNSFVQKYLQQDMVQKMVSGITVPLLSFNIGGLEEKIEIIR